MSPGERALLRAIGRALYGDFAVFTAISLFYGMGILIFVLCTFTLLQRGLASRSTQILFATTLTSFFLFTLRWSFIIAPLGIEIRGILIESGGKLNRATFQRVGDATNGIDLIEAAAAQFLIVISNGIVLWRTLVFYPDQKLIVAGPCMLFLCTIGTSFANVVINSSPNVNVGVPNAAAGITLLASLVVSLATNVVSTLLVLYKLWSYQRFSRKLGIMQRAASPVQKVMIILIESGVVFCGIQVLNLVLQLVPQASLTPASLATHITTGVLIATTAMYPSVVVLLVKNQRSVVEAFGFSTVIKNLEAGSSVEHIPEWPPETDSVSDETRSTPIGYF